MKVLEEHERYSRSELSALQLEKINRVWNHAIVHVPYYTRLFRDRRLPTEFGSLDEYTSCVPVLEKATVRSGMLLSQRADRGKWGYTGGSTGISLGVFWERDAELEIASAKYRSRDLWGIDMLDRTAILWGHGALMAPSMRTRVTKLTQQIKDQLLGRVRFSPYSLGGEDLRRYIRRMNKFRPALLYGYSSGIYLLALEALRTGAVTDSLKLVMLAGEKVTNGIRHAAQRAFKANVVEEYGAAECPLIAYEDTQHLLRIREDIVFVETLPVRDVFYRIIISVLNNPSFPLLRYDIGDLTVKPLTRGKTGFAVIEPVIGRNNDLLITRSGRPLRLDAGVILHMIRHKSSVRRFAAQQFSDGSVLLWLEGDSPAKGIDISGMQRKLAAILEGQTVEVKLTKSIPSTASGKHRWITSELAPSVAS